MTNPEFLKKVTLILTNNFGSYTAEKYSRFYEGKSEDEVMRSIAELLEEFVGPENAAKQLSQIKQGGNI